MCSTLACPLVHWVFASPRLGAGATLLIFMGARPRLRLPPLLTSWVLLAYIGSFSYTERIVLLSRCPRPLYPVHRYLWLGGLLGRKIQLLRVLAWRGCTVCCGGGSIVTVGNTSRLQPRTRLRRQSGRGSLSYVFLAPLL